MTGCVVYVSVERIEPPLITSAALGPLLGSYLHVGFSRVLNCRFAVLFRGFPARPPRVLFSCLFFLSLDPCATTRASFHIAGAQALSGSAIVSRPPFHGSLTHPNTKVNFTRTIRHIFSASSSSIDPSPPFLERRRFGTCDTYRRPRPLFRPRNDSYCD